MAKERKRLNKVEKFYIEQNCTSMSLDEIIKDLNIPKPLARTFFLECKKSAEKESQEEEKRTMPKAGDLLARKTNRGVVVMTRESSEVSDETRKKKASNNDTRHIHKIK